jgi:hypothetical protein
MPIETATVFPGPIVIFFFTVTGETAPALAATTCDPPRISSSALNFCVTPEPLATSTMPVPLNADSSETDAASQLATIDSANCVASR